MINLIQSDYAFRWLNLLPYLLKLQKLTRLLFYIVCFQDAGWKGWGEISYGGYKCVERAKAAELLVIILNSIINVKQAKTVELRATILVGEVMDGRSTPWN